MGARFKSSGQGQLFNALLREFRTLGYAGELVERDYSYKDWLAIGEPDRKIPAALFGRTPIAYDTALIGITLRNGAAGENLVNSHRSLCAPMILEVTDNTVCRWSIGATAESTRKESELELAPFLAWLQHNANALEPKEFLRSKNLPTGPIFLQGTLFAGLIPELEARIGEVLDPLLKMAFKSGMAAYQTTTGKAAPDDKLFKLAFWILAAKVFADRQHPKFAGLEDSPDPDIVLDRIGEHYNDSNTRLLNRATREAVFNRMWSTMDFRNLSVEVLAQLATRFLVTPELRKQLGIHRTRRSIVEYIIDRIPFRSLDLESLHILEPCCGSATFLLGAMGSVRELLPGYTQHERHSYFQRILAGFERDSFNAEISRLCLTLADYPNPNGWNIIREDVFTSKSFEDSLSTARVVLCNPPFENFNEDDMKRYGTASKHAPAALIELVLDHLHADGVLGFVLPRVFLDHRSYASIRRRLVARFRRLDILALPDKGWDYADQETALLIATEPVSHKSTIVSYGVVREKTWKAFDLLHEVPSQSVATKSQLDADETLAIPELREIWDHVAGFAKLGDVAAIHKGLEWIDLTSNWSKIVSDRRAHNHRQGVAPRPPQFWAYQCPPTAWLNISHKLLRRPNALEYQWNAPKIVINKTAKGRGPWRLSAFADTNGLYCGETFLVVWPKNETDLLSLTAILNSPFANAFVTVHEGKREIAISTIQRIPVPRFSSRQKNTIAELVTHYTKSVGVSDEKSDRLLREIDATVLSAYGLPPKLERQLLDFFNGYRRKVPFGFHDYFPTEFKPSFSLAEWLSGRPGRATVDRFRAQPRDLPSHILDALASPDDSD